MRKLALIILTIAFVNLIHAQEPADIHARIRAEVAERDYVAAINDLQSLKTKQPAVFEANNYDYLLARIADKSGDAASAMAGYQTVVNRNSVLKEYALWHLSQLARTSGNLVLERFYLNELVSFSPNSLLANTANARTARSWFDGKNYETAIKLFDERRTTIGTPGAKGGGQVAREELVLLAEAYYRVGNADKARETFTSVISSVTNAAQPDDFALAAVKGLDLLDAGSDNFGKVAPQLSDYEHLSRAQIYQFNRDFSDARLHFLAIVNNYPASGIVPDAIFQIGRGYAQQSNFAEAVKWFERVQEQFPEHQVSKDALLQAASAYARVGKPKEAISRYEKYIAKYPSDERIDRPYLNIIDILRDQGEETEALKWAAKTKEVFREKLPEVLAVFAETRIYLARSDWENALAGLNKLNGFPRLGEANTPGGTNIPEIAFLRGFALEQLRRYPEAVDVYLSLPDGRTEYYGGRATERLRLLANDDAAKQIIKVRFDTLVSDLKSKDAETQRKNVQAALRLTDNEREREKLLDALKKIYASLPAYQTIPNFKLLKPRRSDIRREAVKPVPSDLHRYLAEEFLFLGLYDEAAPELEASLRSTATLTAKTPKQNTDMDYTLAVFYKRGDMANKPSAFIEPLWKVPADYQIELIPHDVLEMIYPAPYAGSLLKYAPPRNVDPRFLLSIMRQESRYRPEVKSYAAARGLMQFISTTSDKIAGELGRDNFRQDELYNPPTAILFGSQYVGNLFRLFPNQPQAVAASYNGGEDNMKRWLGRAKSPNADRYVPEIVFSQSKDYVYKVMANYRIYQIIYDKNLMTAQASRPQ